MPGRKRTSAAKAAIVETKKSRIPAPLFPDLEAEDWEEPTQPAWIAAIPLASSSWDEKVARYKMRRQRAKGFEDSLAQYVALEAAVVESWKNGIAPNVSMLRELRSFANAFFDTPTAQQVTVAPKEGSKNPFARIAAHRARG